MKDLLTQQRDAQADMPSELLVETSCCAVHGAVKAFQDLVSNPTLSLPNVPKYVLYKYVFICFFWGGGVLGD